MTDHADLIAEAREAQSVAFNDNETGYALIIRALADALESQPAPLVADSREALVNAIIQSDALSDDVRAEARVQGSTQREPLLMFADALLASGVVSLAADRDRVVAEQCAQIAEHPTWHPLGRLNDGEHVLAVRIAAAIRAYGAESEGE